MTPMLQIKDITACLEQLAPPAWQEAYDNSGLITGYPHQEVTGILVTLDCTEAVVQEAIDHGANLIVAHHPILFKGLKKITGANYVERVLIRAIRHNIAIYALHTNLDNVRAGVNRAIAERLALQNLRVLASKKGTLQKLVTFAPRENAEAVLSALFSAGAGAIGSYAECSFQTAGIGSFTPNDQAQPHIGQAGKREHVEELRLEVMFAAPQQQVILRALHNSHPYEEVAYYISALENANQEVGSGMIGQLATPVPARQFLQTLKHAMQTPVVRHTRAIGTTVSRVAVCGGAGSFLLNDAITAGADVFVSADFKYHEFFDADGKIMVADIGHYESEQFTKDLLFTVLKEKFPTFAIIFSKTVTNPISYL